MILSLIVSGLGFPSIIMDILNVSDVDLLLGNVVNNFDYFFFCNLGNEWKYFIFAILACRRF